jgi:hypothetical protein
LFATKPVSVCYQPGQAERRYVSWVYIDRRSLVYTSFCYVHTLGYNNFLTTWLFRAFDGCKIKERKCASLMGKLCIGIIGQKDLVSSSEAVAHQLMDFSHIL